MRKIFLLIMMILISSINYAQNCDCSSNLKWLIETFEENDAGFQYVLDKKGKNAYSTHNKIFIEKASKIQSKTACLELLNDWTEFFRKNHLQIVLNENTNTSKAPKELSEKEIIKLYKDSPKFNIKEKDFNKYIANIKEKNGFEGVWFSDPYTIGIIKDKKKSNRDYVGFIIKSKSPYWQPNQIKLEILKNENGKYYMKYYMRDHSIREISNINIVGNNYLLADFVILERIKPILKTEPKIKLYFKSMYANKPFLEKLSDNTLFLRIPSFKLSEKKEIDSLLEKNNKLISSTKNLIIDLRNNGGGSDASYNKIIPYLYTNPIRVIGVQYLSTKLNNQRMIDFMNTPDWSEEDKKWIKNRLEILNKHLGEFVNLKDDIVGVEKLDTILPYPKNVAILINSNCGSTTEQFLLATKQSKKVKLFGTTTLGSLDISNMYYVNSPCGEFKLWYGLTKSYRIPEMQIDGKGIQPDFYFDKTVKPYEWIKETDKILNYK
jgi:effector-binding domain-containing protein